MSVQTFRPTPHPVLRLPTAAEAQALGSQRWAEVMQRREAIIRREREDLFTHLYEPPIWKVADALLGLPWVDAGWAEQMRQHLGFKKRVRTLLILGGNRGSKSQYASHRTMKLLRLRAAARGWALHSTLPMSRQYQQPLFYTYLPAELKGKDIKSATTYIAYKQKTGFSEEQFVLPPAQPGVAGSDLVFKTYDQDVTSIEGGNLDIIWPDELVPANWVETLEFRVAERNGWMVITFTPVQGYSETVKLFQDGAEVVKESVAFLLPKDGGLPDVARALGLEDVPAVTTAEEQLEELHRAQGENRAAIFPQAIPEQCGNWLLGVPSQPAVPAGREFERVPRVMKCVSKEDDRAILFFYSSDNPYGNPKQIAQVLSGKPAAFVRERFYGLATKQASARFPKFNPKVHVIAASQVPATGTNYQVVDPSSGRNFFMVWFRVTPEHVYAYREFPGPYWIPGVGVPGPWALPDGKKPDGKMGPAQATFGWGLIDYKRLIAAVEKWKAAEAAATLQPGGEEVEEWQEGAGTGEAVLERYLDSRFASNPKLENDRPTTLLTDFEDLHLYFRPTPGGPIGEGIQKINDLLNYDLDRPVDFFNKPRLLISAECPNLIFALQTWTGLDGEKGATKDPVDCLRYFATEDCGYLEPAGPAEEEGTDHNYY
jgi:phage terminase large subunit-like protein